MRAGQRRASQARPARGPRSAPIRGRSSDPCAHPEIPRVRPVHRRTRGVPSDTAASREFFFIRCKPAREDSLLYQNGSSAVSHGGGQNSQKISSGNPFVTFDACPQSSSATGSGRLTCCTFSVFTLFTAVSLNHTDDRFLETAARFSV